MEEKSKVRPDFRDFSSLASLISELASFLFFSNVILGIMFCFISFLCSNGIIGIIFCFIFMLHDDPVLRRKNDDHVPPIDTVN
jgi:hypothetical protein